MSYSNTSLIKLFKGFDQIKSDYGLRDHYAVLLNTSVKFKNDLKKIKFIHSYINVCDKITVIMSYDKYTFLDPEELCIFFKKNTCLRNMLFIFDEHVIYVMINNHIFDVRKYESYIVIEFNHEIYKFPKLKANYDIFLLCFLILKRFYTPIVTKYISDEKLYSKIISQLTEY